MPHQQSRLFVSKYLAAKDALSFEASLSYLKQAGGSNRGAARLAGVAESTLRGWATGRRNPSRAAQERVTEAVRGLRTPQTGDDRIRLEMFNSDRRRSGGKHKRRPVDAAHLDLAPGTMQRARNVWVTTGDADAAYGTFVKGIGKKFYRESLANASGINLDDGDLAYEGLSADYGMTII